MTRCENLGRAFEAAGKPILHALVQFLQEPASRVFHGFVFSPVHSADPFGLVAFSDGHRVAKGNSHVRHEAGQNRPETGQ